MVISLLETVIITNVLHHNSLKYREVPRWVRVVVLEHIARLICYRWPEQDSLASGTQTDKGNQCEPAQGPWIIQPSSADHSPSHHPASIKGERLE